jgi:polygalacturonase
LKRTPLFLAAITVSVLASAAHAQATSPQVYDVRAFGAKGDGKTLDSPAINAAIEAAAGAGGGTVHFPAGTYLSYSIRLKSNITLYFDQGSKLLAAPSTSNGQPGYDPPEPNPHDAYQDFGHSHWQNSLIWGENVQNIALLGPGMIDGEGLRGALGGNLVGGPPLAADNRGGGVGGGGGRGQGRGRGAAGTQPGAASGPAATQARGNRGRGGGGGGGGGGGLPAGTGNKILALKNCRNITIRDLTFYRGGHFCILATGADNLTIDNAKFDTNRDAIDIDACKNVRISNCYVNAPNDDGICLKSSYALGVARPTENVTITNCQVSGWLVGSLLDGSFDRSTVRAPDRDGPTGRIKFGTESNGGFKNITISNCVFDHSRGLAIESVDGGIIEDVTVTNLTMRSICNSPIFIRLGNRARGPADTTPVAQIRRITISNVSASNVDPRYPCQIVGIEGHPVEDVSINNLRVEYRGGGTAEQAAIVPPEDDRGYPEPSHMGILPAYGFFARHVKGLSMHRVDFSFVEPEARPVMRLIDVADVEIQQAKAERTPGVPFFVLEKVRDLRTWSVRDVGDVLRERVEWEEIHK